MILKKPIIINFFRFHRASPVLNFRFLAGRNFYTATSAKRTLFPDGVKAKALPFVVDENEADRLFVDWFSMQNFAPSVYKTAEAIERRERILVPFWIFAARARSTFFGEVSDDSTSESTHTKTTRGSQNTTYSYSSKLQILGNIQYVFSEQDIKAMTSLPLQDVLSNVRDPNESEDLVSFDIDLMAAKKRAESWIKDQETIKALRNVKGKYKDAPYVTDLEIDTKIDYDIHAIYLPIYLRYGPKGSRVLINGYSGRYTGPEVNSPFRACLAVTGLSAIGVCFFGIPPVGGLFLMIPAVYFLMADHFTALFGWNDHNNNNKAFEDFYQRAYEAHQRRLNEEWGRFQQEKEEFWRHYNKNFERRAADAAKRYKEFKIQEKMRRDARQRDNSRARKRWDFTFHEFEKKSERRRRQRYQQQHQYQQQYQYKYEQQQRAPPSQAVTRVTHARTLGVSANASQSQIREKFMKLAQKWHPDKFDNSDDAEKVNATKKFQNILEAFEALRNDKETATRSM